VTVAYNGPYFVRGELELQAIPPDMPGTAFRAALCRCGQSANKPFCDNSHEKVGFKDYGAVGERGEAISSKDGKLTIQPLPDGPLMLSGTILPLRMAAAGKPGPVPRWRCAVVVRHKINPFATAATPPLASRAETRATETPRCPADSTAGRSRCDAADSG